MRRKMTAILVAVALLGGCAQLKREPSAPICDGKHQRPANARGSVLTPSEDQPAQIGPAAAVTNLSFARCDA